MKITTAARILAIFSDGKPSLTKTQLAERLGVSKGAVSSALSKLDKMNLAWGQPRQSGQDPWGRTRNSRSGRGRFIEDLWSCNGECPAEPYTEEQCQQFINDGAGADDMWF